MNNFIGIGRWAKDVELRFTPNGKAVATGTIAINEGFGDKKYTTYIPVVMWGKIGENTAQYRGGKGSQIAIEGRVSVRKYQDKEGKDRYATEIVAESVEFIGSDGNKEKPIIDDPFAGGPPIDIPDDLPF